MIINGATLEDISKMCFLHSIALDENHFTSTFNSKLLVRYFQKLLVHNKYNYVAIEESDLSLAGFLIAGFKTNEAVKEFTKENFIPILLILIKNPRFIKEKIIGLLRKFTSHDKIYSLIKPRLFLIEISPSYRKKGFAKELISHFERELKKDKINIYGLSVRKTNLNAIEFYNKNNFRVDKCTNKSIYYIKDISN